MHDREPGRVALVFDSGPSGVAALRQAAAMMDSGPIDLTVLSLAPQDTSKTCCGAAGRQVYNAAIRDDAEHELDQARDALGDHAARARFVSLVQGREAGLRDWVRANGIDVVLLPAQRFTAGGHPMARKLRRAAATEVRVVRA